MSGSYVYEWDEDGDGTFSTDISAYVLSCKTKRGRKDDLGRISPGTATLVLNNEDGRFSPDKAAGPYYGNLKPYRRIRIKGTVVGASTYGVFYGFVLDWTIRGKATQQTVTWFIGDRFALWQDMKLNQPMLRKIPVKCALDMAVNRAVGDNECDNPSVETDLTDYSGLQSVTPVRDATMKIEGDYTVFCDCPGDNAGEGWRYDATGQVNTGLVIIARVWAKASETVTLKFQAVNSTTGVRTSTTASVGTTPTLLELQSVGGFLVGESHYFELITNAASEVLFWSDGLYFITGNPDLSALRDLDAGTAEIELAASYRQPALQLLQDIADSEPRSFFFIYCDNTNYLDRLRFRDKDWRATAIAAGPVATFSDDGADVPWFDVVLAERARERISEAEVASQGDFEDDNKSATVWELVPVPVRIPATETMIFHAKYSQPCRDASHSLNPGAGGTLSPGIADNAHDAIIRKYGDAYPPGSTSTSTSSNLVIGQQKRATTPLYQKFRTYLRWNTNGKGTGSLTDAKLRLRLAINNSDTAFTIQVRDKVWTTIDAADWDGTGTIRGTYDTADLPPTGEWIEIDLATAGINLSGWTEFELTSDRDVADTTPTGKERVNFYSHDQGAVLAAQLLLTFSGEGPSSEAFEQYGIGGKITIVAGSDDFMVNALKVNGVPLRGSSEESKVVEASANPPAIEGTLPHALPLQGTRTPSMETEAGRLADRYDDDDPPKRISLVLRPKDDTVLTQMLAREIGELIHVENINDPFSTYIDANFWIEGIDHDLGTGGKHTATFHLEEQ